MIQTKKLVAQFFFLLSVFQYTNAQQAPTKNLTIKGDLTKLKEQISWVKFFWDSNNFDSCKVVNGRFSYAVHIEKAGVLEILFPINPAERYRYNYGDNYYKQRLHAFYFEPGVKTITWMDDSVYTAVVKGSVYNPPYQDFIKKQDAALNFTYPLYKEAKELLERKDTTAYIKLSEVAYKKKDSANGKFCTEYALKNPKSPILFYVLRRAEGFPFNVGRMQTIFSKLPGYVQNSREGKALKKKIEDHSRIDIGKMAPDFVQADTSGNPFRLSSLIGKYVLVDFWASWCGPCRRENPHLVNAYKKYHDKNFEIVSVSLDDSTAKSAWLAAIKKDNLNLSGWVHVSDLNGNKNAVAKIYLITAIPQNVLIDPNGKIIDKNLRGEDLQNKLAEILK